MDATLRGRGAFASITAAHPAVHKTAVDEKDGSKIHVFVRVRGRLDGGAAKPYHLRLIFDEGVIECQDFLVAAMGGREGGGGIVLTRQGALEILSSEIEIGHRTHFTLIDPISGRKQAYLSSTWERHPWIASPSVHPDGRVFWKTAKGICLDLDRRDGFAVASPEQCKDDEAIVASPQDAERVRALKVFEDDAVIERLEHDLWRQKGVPFLIHIWGVVCT